MIDRLPFVRPFTPAGLRWRLVDAVVEGPAGFGLPTTRISTDGGGWWEAEFADMKAATPTHHRALRAMALRMRGGARLDVPFVELSPTGGLVPTGFADGSTFSDGSGFLSGSVTAVLAEAVALNDDSCRIQIEGGTPLLGGDVFSIWRGAELGSEMHATDGVEQIDAGLWQVSIGPQFRQAWAAGTVLNFNEPHCAMRLVDPDGGMWPRFDRSWHGRASARFVEALR